MTTLALWGLVLYALLRLTRLERRLDEQDERIATLLRDATTPVAPSPAAAAAAPPPIMTPEPTSPLPQPPVVPPTMILHSASAEATLRPDAPGPRVIAAAPPPPGETVEERIVAALPYVGLVLLAIGFAYLANLVHQRLTPGWKTAIAYAGALALFGVGRRFERTLERVARPVMIGGLALAYFVSYAAHFVEPMRCVPLARTVQTASVDVNSAPRTARSFSIRSGRKGNNG